MTGLAAARSKLYYHGTETEVRLGDRVELRTIFLRRRKTGTVVCIPEKSAIELDAEGRVPEDWLIKLDDGTYTGWMYYPEDRQPVERVRFLARADGPHETISNEELDAMDAAEMEKSSGCGEFLGCLVVGALFVGLLAWVISLFR